MAKIKVMSAHLANMIAAGEVVERPSSVIKELVENSLDAKSKNIEVRIYQSGRKKIIVKDDGFGMDKDDAITCFQRHASSKLLDEYQLFKIKTMGFRGEALPSIASVSKVTMETSDGIEGSKVIVSEDNFQYFPSARSKGTTFTVEELFYNTPVRLKYLKSDYTETSSCQEIMERLALANNRVSFSFYIDDRLAFSTTGRGDLLETISRIYGTEIAKKLIKVEYQSDAFSIDGYISKPELTRSNRYQMMTFINKRNVYLPKIQNAILDGYGTYLFSNRYPFCTLMFSIDTSLVDVNVHPSKKEVRLSNESEIINSLKKVVKDKLDNLTPLQEVTLNIKREEAKPVSLIDALNAKENNNFIRKNISVESKEANEDVSIDIINNYDDLDQNIDFNTPLELNDISKENNERSIQFNFKVIGQIHKTYIVLEGEDGFYLVDQHAANERINYEKFDAIFNSHLETIRPLSPILLSFSPSEILKFTQDKKRLLANIGIECDIFGNNLIKVETYPLCFEEKDVEMYLEEVISLIFDNKEISLSTLRKHVIATMACKASIKANDALTMLEMETLIKDLFKCQNPSTCPHGRPTIIHFTSYEIEKMFKRNGI